MSMGRKILLVTALLFSSDAMAYFDPGTGSMLIQGLIAGVAMVAVFFGQIKDYILTLLRLKKPADESSEDE